MPRKKREPKRIAVIDFETDPFKHGRVPKPFAAGFYDGEIYREFYGEKCVEYLMDFISTLDGRYIIYAHNGGKFDFFFMLEYLDNPLKIINGRITKAGIRDTEHELRDSYAIIPYPLKAYEKDVIDYRLFEADKRDANKSDILHYLARDCEYLYCLVSAFNKRFGDRLTIGGTAIATLKSFHPFQSTNKTHDDIFRFYYFGGRVQAFKTGEINGSFKIFDVNSMYPAVMRNCKHPTGSGYVTAANPKILPDGNLKNFGDRPYFARIIAKNHGALPIRTKNGLDFTCKYGEFYTMSHEIKVALKHRLLDIVEIKSVMLPRNTISFVEYVDTFSAEKIAAKKSGDKIAEIFSKLLLNSAYGKFGQNPENYFDYMIIRDVSELPNWQLWDLFEIHGDYQIWRKPANATSYFDVATAASITSASRAVLLDGLSIAENPVYCDTDSIICEEYEGNIHDTELGAWKNEGEADRLFIAGKKLYAAFQGRECVKMASKGARLTPTDIIKICRGGSIEWANDAPSFSLSHDTNFVKRKISMKNSPQAKFGV